MTPAEAVGEAAPAGLLDRCDAAFRAGGIAREVDRDVGAMLGAADRHRAADAGRGTGDEDGLSFEQLHLTIIPSVVCGRFAARRRASRIRH